MSARQTNIRFLNEADYRQICYEVCKEFGTSVTAESLMFALCKRVYHHIYGYRRDLTLPYASGPRQEVYKAELSRLVGSARVGPGFDPLEVAAEYIKGI